MEEGTILAQLRTGFAEGSLLHDGRVLPERQLALRLGTSRARLRRALEALEAEGAIFRRHGQGTFITPPPAVQSDSLQTLARQVTPQNVMEVRLEVEPALAALAAERATSCELGTLDRMMRATLGAADMAAYEAADDVFHFRIAELAHNSLFLTIFQAIRAVRLHAHRTDRRHELPSAARIARLGRQHESLFRHIADRAPGPAAELMEEHLITGSTMLRHRHVRRAGAAPACLRRETRQGFEG